MTLEGGIAFVRTALHALDARAEGEIIQGGETTVTTFTTPGPGSYYFYCDVHPTEMTGEFIVDASLVAGAPGAASPAASVTP